MKHAIAQKFLNEALNAVTLLVGSKAIDGSIEAPEGAPVPGTWAGVARFSRDAAKAFGALAQYADDQLGETASDELEMLEQMKSITIDGAGRYCVAFSYNTEMITALRDIDGRIWDPAHRHWLVPPRSRAQLVEFAKRFDMPEVP